jgi:hypothetical protein
MKEKADFEVYCYEAEDGAIRLEFDNAAINFSKKRFLEFADKLNEMRQAVLRNYLEQNGAERKIINAAYRM